MEGLVGDRGDCELESWKQGASTMLAQLPPELLLHTVSFLTRTAVVDPRLAGLISREPALVPDLHSINALSRTNTVFHHILDQNLYALCASVPAMGRLALLFAVEHQLESTFDKLVAAGSDLDFGPFSLLHLAASRGFRAMAIKLLRAYGEGMAARAHARDRVQFTALDYAARAGHMDIVQLLAPIIMPSVSIIPSISYEPQEKYLSTALMGSAYNGHLEISKYLLSRGADVNVLDERFYVGTPLFLAVGSENLELVQLLLASGADPNRSGNTGVVPLFRAATFRSIDIAQALLAAGAKVDAQDNESQNVLFYIDENIDMLRFFLECGADPNHRDNFGRTPLRHWLNWYTKVSKLSVELLLQFGAATTEETDNEGLNLFKTVDD
ncbi:ankyrin repeat-containing domain protein [Mycena haematopus]|nr:ankyrin repeat-containing domain protein [Mycena haematopus]